MRAGTSCTHFFGIVRILLVGPHPIDSAAVGGLQASFGNLVSWLGELPDVEPHVISFVPRLKRATRRNVENVPVDYLPVSSRFGFLTRHGASGNRLKECPARTYLMSYTLRTRSDPGMPEGCARNPRRSGSPRDRSRSGQHMPSGSDRLRLTMFGVPVERYCIRHAWWPAHSLPERYFGREIRGRIVEVGNPISDSFFSVDPAPDRGVILYRAGVIPLKRLLDLVEAMPRILAVVPEARLRVAGSELDAEYAKRMGGRVHELSLEARVAFLGILSPDEMVDKYRHASICVLTSGAGNESDGHRRGNGL
jgi:glycosyltransferase involved in cell wall biosynthesis